MDSVTTRAKFKYIGCSVILAGALALGGCSGYDSVYHGNSATQGKNLESAKSALKGSQDFNGSLARDYYNIADRRAQGQDWTDSDWFARKSIAASANETVTPEFAQNWLIPGNADQSKGEPAVMNDARGHLVSALDGGGRTRFPSLAARTQTLYDCWLERSEHNGAAAFNGQCRQGFVRDYTDLNVLLNPPGLRNAYFAYNSAELTPAGRDQVRQAAALIKDGTARLKIVGKADRSGKDASNMKLSQRRVEAIRDALVAEGIAVNRIDVQATGEQQLPVATKNGVREEKNRVVQINTLMPSSQVAELTE